MASLLRGWASRKASPPKKSPRPKLATWRVRPAPISAKMKTAPRDPEDLVARLAACVDRFTGFVRPRLHAHFKFFKRFVLALAEEVHLGQLHGWPRRRRDRSPVRPVAAPTQAMALSRFGKHAHHVAVVEQPRLHEEFAQIAPVRQVFTHIRKQ